MTRRPIDQDARDIACEDFSRSVALEAAAGTGKTEALAGRVVEAVAGGHARMARVAAITFTRKAAGELQVRLRTKLARALKEQDRTEDEQGLLYNGLMEVEQASISTIHAFAESLLRAEPFTAELDPDFRVIEATETSLMFQRVWERWRHGAMQDPTGRLPALMRATANLLVDKKTRKSGPPYDWATSPIKDEHVSSLARAISENRGDLAPLPDEGACPAFVAEMDAFLPELLHDLRSVTPDESKLKAGKTGDTLYQGLLASLARLEALQDVEDWRERFYGLTSVDIPTGAGSKAKWKSNEDLATTREASDELHQRWRAFLARSMPTACQWRNLPWTREAIALAEEVADAFAAVKQAEALVDFDDLLWRLRDLLRRSDEARAVLAARFDLVLVDECQDVDQVQLEIILLLTGRGDPDGEDYQSIPGRLYFVGDPKQSIFRFRGADLAAYSRARERIGASAHALTLEQNFRSRRAVCDAVNHAFAPVMDAGGHQAGYVPVRSWRDQEAFDQQAALLALPIPDTWLRDHKQPTVRNADAAAIASFLSALHEGSLPMPFLVRGERTGEIREAKLGDVVILCHRFGREQHGQPSHVGRIERALDAFSVPFVTIGGKEYFARREVRNLHGLLRALDEPYDAQAVVAALRGPVFALNDQDLLEWKLEGGVFNPIVPTSVDHPTARALDRLNEIRRAVRGVGGLRAAVSRALEDSGLLEIHAAQHLGAGRVANLLKVVEMASAAEDAGIRTLRGFVRFLGDRIDTKSDEEDILLDAGRAQDAVRVMTVHKAKGLAAPVVVLYDWFRGESTRPGHLLRDTGGRWVVKAGPLEAPGWEVARVEEARREHAELVRLGYVAATRARDWLVASAFPEELRADGPLSPLRPLFTREHVDPPGDSCVATDIEVRVWTPDEAIVPSALRSAPPEEVQDHATRARHGLDVDWREWQEQVQAGGSAGVPVLAARDELVASLELPDVDIIVSVPPSEADALQCPADQRGDRRGELVHRLLEGADLSGLSDGDAPVTAARAVAERMLPVVRGMVIREGWGEEEVAKLLDMATRLLATPIMKEVARARRVLHEVPFAFRAALRQEPSSEVLVTGVIDLAFEDHSGLWWVADYKTGLVSPERLVHLHGAQIRVYAQALSEHLGSAPVSAALISLVEEQPTRASEPT
jgi:ATP-dependent helicase/nuclease subunit A